MIIKYLLEKEFKQLFRNIFIPKIILVMTLNIILIMPWAANQEIRGINLSVVDNDHSLYSTKLINKITSSRYFNLSEVSSSNSIALKTVAQGKSDIILELQYDFEKNLMSGEVANVMISANAVNGVKAGLGTSYLANILNDFSHEIREENHKFSGKSVVPIINIETQNNFNPYLDYKLFMIPALIAMLLTMIAGFLPALNIVSEKEIGTIEQINVTPVNKFIFILSKLIPYWVIGFVVISICFILSALVYGIYPSGNLITIYFFASLYILVISGLGLVISNYSSTIQQAMFIMFYFMMIFNLMSGLFTPINSMPGWAQDITIFIPLKYFIQVLRMIYLKGSSISDLVTEAIALISFALFFNIWAVISYKKSS